MAVDEINAAEASTDFEIYESDGGKIVVNDEVLAFIATLEIVKVDGVMTLSGRSSISDYEGAKSKEVEKGVAVKTNGNRCTVIVEINMRYGVNIYDTAKKLQRSIKSAIESYAGMVVESVDITIRGMMNEASLPVQKRV